MKRHLLLTLLLLVGTHAAAAQGFTRIDETRTNTAFFYYAIPGEATVQVSVLGTVRVPGIYVVSADTRLDELLAITGGVQERETPDSFTDVTVRLLRPTADEREVIYTAPLDTMLQQPGQYPALQEGDVMMVRTNIRRKFGWRDGLQIASSVGTLTLLVLRIIAFTN